MPDNNGWRPIAEAPRNGSLILLCCRYIDGDEGGMVVGGWNTNWNEWTMNAQAFHLYNTGDESDDIIPYAWMPLPQPPQPEEKP